MLGLNKLVTIKRPKRIVKPSGASQEAEQTIVAMHIPAAIQPYVLRTMPPPPEIRVPGGELYRQDFGCWIPIKKASDIRENDIIEDESTGDRYNVVAVTDAAGRGHHWLIRLRKWS